MDDLTKNTMLQDGLVNANQISLALEEEDEQEQDHFEQSMAKSTSGADTDAGTQQPQAPSAVQKNNNSNNDDGNDSDLPPLVAAIVASNSSGTNDHDTLTYTALGYVEGAQYRGLDGNDIMTVADSFTTHSYKILGDDGNDTITGNNGNDTLIGGNDRDTISGGSGNDYITGNNGDDNLGTGLSGGNGNDHIDGGSGDDLIDGGSGDDSLFGDQGDDVFKGGTGTNMIVGDGPSPAGNDTVILEYELKDYEISYQVVRDFQPNPNNSFIVPLSFISLERDGVETQLIYQDIENFQFANGTYSLGQVVAANHGLLKGDFDHNGKVDGDDYALWKNNFGETGNNDADGSGNGRVDAGDYTIWRDHLGSSINNLTVNTHVVALDEAGDLEGNDEIDIMFGSNAENTLDGKAGNDILFGGTQNDTLNGGDDHDHLYGGAGNDFLLGEDGNDTLNGGDNMDILVGGSGRNTYNGGDDYDVAILSGNFDHYAFKMDNENIIVTALDGTEKHTFIGTSVEEFVFNGDQYSYAQIADTAQPLAGDYNRDGFVNTDDYAAWKSNFGATGNNLADGNGDGHVNAADYTIWRDNLGASKYGSLAGDYDNNGVVDQDDRMAWTNSYGATGNNLADGNGDGRVDAADYTIWRDNLGNEIRAEAISFSSPLQEAIDNFVAGSSQPAQLVSSDQGTEIVGGITAGSDDLPAVPDANPETIL